MTGGSYPQRPAGLWMDSAGYFDVGDRTIAAAVEQMRFWRREGLRPRGIFERLGRRYIARPFEPVDPSWDDAVWLIAEIYQTLSTKTVFVAADEPQQQLPLQFRRAA